MTRGGEHGRRERGVRHHVVVVAIAAALVLTACGGDGDASGGSGGDGPTVEIQSDGDPVDAASSAPDLGAVDIPLHPSADGVASTETGPLTTVQFIVPLDERDSAIAFYDEWTSSQRDEYQRVEAEAGGVSWQNSPAVGGDKHIIAVLAPLEGDDFAVVTLTVGPLE